MYTWAQIACCSEHTVSVTRVAFSLFLCLFPTRSVSSSVLMTQKREKKLERKKGAGEGP